jgi:3D (Asp-Asp-Asp) domain-containing protein
LLKTLVAIVLILTGVASGSIETKSAEARNVKKMYVLRTAYCLQGTMANGHRVHPGAVAVDPRYIPMGSRMFIPGYGRGRAEDTGGAVKGYHVDVWVSSCAMALRMTRHVTITVYR